MTRIRSDQVKRFSNLTCRVGLGRAGSRVRSSVAHETPWLIWVICCQAKGVARRPSYLHGPPYPTVTSERSLLSMAAARGSFAPVRLEPPTLCEAINTANFVGGLNRPSCMKIEQSGVKVEQSCMKIEPPVLYEGRTAKLALGLVRYSYTESEPSTFRMGI